jgi:hypothetical protein
VGLSKSEKVTSLEKGKSGFNDFRKETSMTKRALITLLLAMLLSASLILSASAATGTRVDIRDGMRTDRINSFNLGVFPMEDRHATSQLEDLQGNVMPSSPARIPVGSALSPNLGDGPGTSIDVTWDDILYTWGQGRHVVHYWNGEYGGTADVSVHFAYRDSPDTLAGTPFI